MSARYVRTPVDAFEAVPWLHPEVVDAAPHDVKEGLARRRLAAFLWRCPCGGIVSAPEGPEPLPEPLEHALDCPGHPDALDAAFDRWAQWLAGER